MENWGYYFGPKVLDESEKEQANMIYSKFQGFARDIQNHLNEGRYKSLVLTHLEIAGMFATKSISHEDKK